LLFHPSFSLFSRNVTISIIKTGLLVLCLNPSLEDIRHFLDSL
jgi:hypothetical protein